eukprot:9498635-Pyramimonas_sp.AAC.2
MVAHSGTALSLNGHGIHCQVSMINRQQRGFLAGPLDRSFAGSPGWVPCWVPSWVPLLGSLAGSPA